MLPTDNLLSLRNSTGGERIGLAGIECVSMSERQREGQKDRERKIETESEKAREQETDREREGKKDGEGAEVWFLL